MGMCSAPSAWPACHSSSSRTSSRKSPSLRSVTSTVGTPAPKLMSPTLPESPRGERKRGGSSLVPQGRQLRLPLGDVGAQPVGDLLEQRVGVVRGEPEHAGDRTLLQFARDEGEQ